MMNGAKLFLNRFCSKIVSFQGTVHWVVKNQDSSVLCSTLNLCYRHEQTQLLQFLILTFGGSTIQNSWANTLAAATLTFRELVLFKSSYTVNRVYTVEYTQKVSNFRHNSALLSHKKMSQHWLPKVFLTLSKRRKALLYFNQFSQIKVSSLPCS